MLLSLVVLLAVVGCWVVKGPAGEDEGGRERDTAVRGPWILCMAVNSWLANGQCQLLGPRCPNSVLAGMYCKRQHRVCLVCWFRIAWLGILAWASQACFQEARGVCLVACDAEPG
jgi:hypothetical protein